MFDFLKKKNNSDEIADDDNDIVQIDLQRHHRQQPQQQQQDIISLDGVDDGPNGKYSGDPWVKVLGEDSDPEQGIKITLDWNDEFIMYLRSNGYQGSTEEILIGKWLGDLERQLNPITEGVGDSDFQ